MGPPKLWIVSHSMEVKMIAHDFGDCTEVLLDLICYEIYRENLSPEMEAILASHLAECECCRTKFYNMKQLIEQRSPTHYIQ
jgi:hypothetical protein